MELDETIYSLKLNPLDSEKIETIRAIAKIKNCNFLEAKKISCNNAILLKGKALEIKLAIRILKENNITYSVEPKYVYDS